MPRAPDLVRTVALLTNQRLSGDAPVAGIVGARKTVKKAKPALKKKNSKGEIVKKKGSQTYLSVIKTFLKENPVRGGATRQAIAKYVMANYTGTYKNAYLKIALAKGVAKGVLEAKVKGHRFVLSAQEKKSKKAKKPKVKKAKKTDKKAKNTDKKAKNTDKKAKKAKTPKEKTTKKADKKAKTPKAKAPKEKPAKVVAKPASTSTRGVPKAAKSTTTTPTATASTGDLIWVWQYFDGGFRNYDSHASDVVEGVYQEYLTSPFTCDVRAVQSGQWQYEIDFRLMTQRNIQHESHTVRRIRRIQIPAAEKGMKHKVYPGDEKYEHRSEKK